MAPNLGGLLGENSAARQLVVWQVLAQLIGAVMAPQLELLQRRVNKLLPSTPLSPEQLADMTVRHIVDLAGATSYARESGIQDADFKRLVEQAGEGLGVQQLAEALRRQFIPEGGTGPDVVSFEQGIAESHVFDKYGPLIKRLATADPTPADALDALLEGQLTEDVARDLFTRFGGNPDHFKWLFNTRGSAPTPLELSEMANRGIIPWDGEGPDVVSDHQGFLEGPWRNKWEEPYRQLAVYRPPARTIVAMIGHGSITDDQALSWFRDLGLDQVTAQAMLTDAHHQKLQATKDLAKGDVEQLYQDQVITPEQATQMLRDLDYSAEEAAFILQLVNVRQAVALENQATSRIHTLYVARKLAKQDASTALDALSVTPARRDQLFAAWDVERDNNVKVLTAAEIASAYFFHIIDQDTATQELQAIGYDERDAWILLSVRMHGPQPNPPEGVTVPQQNAGQ